MAVPGIPVEKLMAFRGRAEMRLYNTDEGFYVGMKGNGSGGSAADLYFTNPSGNIGALSSVGGLSIGSVTSQLAGVINAHVGFRVAGAAATNGNFLRGNSTNFVSSGIQASDIAALAMTWTSAHVFNNTVRVNVFSENAFKVDVGLDTYFKVDTDAGEVSSNSLIPIDVSADIGKSGSPWANIYGNQLHSTIANGTAPLTVTSQTMVTNLNANLIGGVALAGLVQTSRTIGTQHSLTGGGDLSANRTLNLVNDVASPGNSKYYGTNSSGTRGFFDLPSGVGGDPDTVDEATLQTTTSDETNIYASDLSAAGVAYVNVRICARWLIAPSTYHGYVYESVSCVRWNGLSLITSTDTATELGTGVGSVTVSITSSGANFVVNVTGNGQTVEWKAIVTHFSV